LGKPDAGSGLPREDWAKEWEMVCFALVGYTNTGWRKLGFIEMMFS